MKNKILLGSTTAKNGFKNEKEVADKFNNWQNDNDAQAWLIAMNYQIQEIESVKAIVISGHKADINVQILIKLKSAIDIENIQVKLVSNSNGFNQIDKRWLKNYQLLWNIPKDVYTILQYFTGELSPKINNPKDKRRMFVSEFSPTEQLILLTWLKKNKFLILCDIIKGRGEFSAEWILVINKVNDQTYWTLRNINEVLDFYAQGEVQISPKGSIKIGNITMQRKGGDGGRDTAKMLQFKLNPLELFTL